MTVYSLAVQVFLPIQSAFDGERPARLDEQWLLAGDLSRATVQRLSQTDLPQLGWHFCSESIREPTSLFGILQNEVRMGVRHLALPDDETHRPLQQLIRSDPQDRDHWSVYADWLAERELTQPFLASAFCRAAHQIPTLTRSGGNQSALEATCWVEVETSPHRFTAHCASPVVLMSDEDTEQPPPNPNDTQQLPETLRVTWWTLLDDIWAQAYPPLEAALAAHDAPAT